jgi:hypothetical protein
MNASRANHNKRRRGRKVPDTQGGINSLECFTPLKPTSRFTRAAAFETSPEIPLLKDSTMPRARTPLAKAKATGRTIKDPKRFKDRKEPVVKDPLGDPPKWMKRAEQKEAWRTPGETSEKPRKV